MRDFFLVHSGDFRDLRERKRTQELLEFGKAFRAGLNVGFVDQIFLDQNFGDGIEQRHIGAGLRAEMDISILREFDSARIDDDQRSAARARLVLCGRRPRDALRSHWRRPGKCFEPAEYQRRKRKPRRFR